jgi:hypothetical protein
MALVSPLPAAPNTVARPQQWPLPPTAPQTMTWPRPGCRGSTAACSRSPRMASGCCTNTPRPPHGGEAAAERWRRNSRCQRA